MCSTTYFTELKTFILSIPLFDDTSFYSIWKKKNLQDNM